eukprot:1092974-Rhodomonas_salina.4
MRLQPPAGLPERPLRHARGARPRGIAIRPRERRSSMPGSDVEFAERPGRVGHADAVGVGAHPVRS